MHCRNQFTVPLHAIFVCCNTWVKVVLGPNWLWRYLCTEFRWFMWWTQSCSNRN